MRLRALAKINLGLDVLRKREDGYHEVRMVMQTIRMYDQLDITRNIQPGIHIKTNLPYLPVNENNLVFKAAKLLMDEFQIQEGLSIQLKKVIPVSAGMAGGSSDAAAALVGVNKIFALGLSRKELMERGRQIGADVPYCVMRGTALAEGIGEILTPLPPVPQGYVLVGKPGVNVSTKFVYGRLDAANLKEHPDIDGMVAALGQKDLRQVDEIKKSMVRWGALNALMSGSGPTVFGLFDDREKAEYASEKLKKSRLVKQSFLTSFYNLPDRGRMGGKNPENGGNTNDI